MKVVFVTATLTRPSTPFLNALEESVKIIKREGWEEGYANDIGCPYISHARARLTRKALDADADVIIYLDYDLSWQPDGLLKLLNVKDDVVTGTYRFKKDEEEYMGTIKTDRNDRPIVRSSDGCIWCDWAPGGFLKVTRKAIRKIMQAYPELLYGDPDHYSIDLFNHGAHKGIWYGEDYAFSRRWNEIGGQIWLVPDINITHHDINSGKSFSGNYHNFLLRQTGGSEA